MVGIYQIQSKIKPERIYIGSAVDITCRWRTHLSILRKNKHHSKKLQNHFNKYGEVDLQFSILLSCDEKELIAIEQFFLDSYKTYFNIRTKADSNLGIKRSEESKRKHSKSTLGKKLSDEHKKNISKSLVGNKRGLGNHWNHSEESKQKISKSHTGIKLSEEHKRKLVISHLGKKVSEETRAKMSISHRGKTLGYKHTKESLQKMRGRRLSVEHKGKLSESGRGKHSNYIPTKESISRGVETRRRNGSYNYKKDKK